MRLCILALLALPILACSSGPGDNPGSGEGLTYYADVAPVLETYCTRCHSAAGQGPGNFDDPDTVVSMGELIVGAVAAGLMPPPAADPTCADYVGSERMVIPDEAKTLLSEWVADGKQLGSPEEAVTVAPWDTELDDADTFLEMAFPYTPAFDDPANPGNEYRCFILENDRTEPFYVTAYAPSLGVPELVHHIVVFLADKDEEIPGYEEETGVDCINNVGVGAERMLAGWAPGMLPVRLPEGRGIQILPSQNIVIQMHYYDNGTYDGAADQSGYALKTVSDVDVPLLMLPAGANGFAIPAGDSSYSHSEDFELPAGLGGKIYTTFPHMHVLGKSYDMTIEHSDGSTTCVSRAEAYDFDNQLSYALLEPIPLTGGDILRQTCTWDNSTSNPDLIHDPPVDTFYGERTDEEMCFTFLLASIFEF